MMSKEKDNSVDDEFDLFEDDEGMESDADLRLLEEGGSVDASCNDVIPSFDDPCASKVCKHETRRRLEAYLERKWFREHGWDDEDELFNDELFADLTESVHHPV